MAKDDDTGEFEQIGGADWLLSQLRGDRSAEEVADHDEEEKASEAAADSAEGSGALSDAAPDEVAPVESEPVRETDPFADFARPAEPSGSFAPIAESVPAAEPAPATPSTPEPFVPVEPTIETLFAPNSAAELRVEPLAPPVAADVEPEPPLAEPVAAEPAPVPPATAEPVFRRESPADYFSTAPLTAPDETQREPEPQNTTPEPAVENSLPTSARTSFTAPVFVTPEPVAPVAPVVPVEAAVPAAPIVAAATAAAAPLEPVAPPTPVAPPAEPVAPTAEPAASAPPEPAAAAPAAGGFQWGLAPSDDPDPIVASSAPSAEPAASAPAAPSEAVSAADDEVRLRPQTEEPLETVAIDLGGTDERAPFSPVAASESVNAEQPTAEQLFAEPVVAPGELFEPVVAEPDDSIDLPDALADAMALPDGEPGAAAFGRPPAVPVGGASEASPWFAETAPIDVLDTPAAAAGIVPAVNASDVARGAAQTPTTAREGFVPLNPAQGGGNGTPPMSPAAPGSGVPKPLLWVAGALLAVLVLVGLFFLGTRLGGGAPAAEPTPSPTPSAEASAEPTAPVLPTGTQPPGDYAWNELGGGECLDPFASPWDEKFTVVDCAAPHAGQLVLRSNYGDTSATPFPGEASFAEQINAACTAPGVIDLAAAAGYGDVQVQGSYPVTEEEWASGTAAYFCFVSRSSGEPLTSTLVPAV